MMNRKLFFVFGMIIVSLAIVSADVGLGVSPSKLREQIVSGDSYEYNLFVFNTGSDVISVDISVSDDLKEFVTLSESTLVIEPEPLPHELPLKNAKMIKIIVDAPKVNSEKNIFGKVSIVGGGDSSSNFGGSVGVSSQIEFIIVPSDGIFSNLSTTHYIAFSLIVFVVTLSLLFRRIGFTIRFTKKTVSKKKR